MTEKPIMNLRMASGCLLLLCGTVQARAEDDARLCYSRAETRDRIHAEHLVEPFALVRTTAGALRADLLGARLCRTGGALVYEIDLLGRDGRLIRKIVDASTGRPSDLSR